MPGAGGIAIWAGEQLGSAIASQGIDFALSYLGLGATSTDAKALAEINSKLDTITSQLDQVNQHLTDISSDIKSLQEQLDVSTKEILATITSLDLRNYYGTIDNWFGSKALDVGALQFLSVRHGASPSVWQSHMHSATSFATKLDDVWSAIENIATVLTRSAAENDSTLVRWATYLISQMVPQGTAVDFEPFAQLLQSWFVEAVAYQLKGFVLVKLCIGHDADAQSDARARMAAKMSLQCDLYRSCVERMALSVLRPAPSGPMLGTERLPRVPPGCESSLLRADILCRCFVTALAVPSTSDLGHKMSGIYGRVLYRPSDVVGPQPPDVPRTCQQSTGSDQLTTYHGINSRMEASFSPVTEFQCVDWYQPLGVHQLASPQKSGMRFARYYWDIPLLSHYVEAYTPPRGNGVRQGFLQACRKDATVSLFELGELRQLKINPDGGCDLGDSNPATARFAVVVSWLDLWSHAGMGLVDGFDDAPFDHVKPADPWLAGERSYLGNHYADNANIYVSANSRETLQRLLLMTWDATQRLNVQTCGNTNRPPARGASLPVYREMTEFTLSWDGGNFAEMQYGGSIESVGDFLFTTAADEQGHILLSLRGKIQLDRTQAAPGVFMKTSVALMLKAQSFGPAPGSSGTPSYTKLFDSSDKIDFTGRQSIASQTIDLLVDDAPIALQPGSTYTLHPRYTVNASPDYNHSLLGTTNRFSARGGKVVDQLKITLTDAGIVRPVSSGYRKIG